MNEPKNNVSFQRFLYCFLISVGLLFSPPGVLHADPIYRNVTLCLPGYGCPGDPPKKSAAPRRDTCAEAKIAIDWVLNKNRGARETYDGVRRRGEPPLAAVIWAQHHNRHAQAMLRECLISADLVRDALNKKTCGDARVAIEWVLLRDRGARGTYEDALVGGDSPLGSVIAAQRHNPHAQQTIRDCSLSGDIVQETLEKQP